MNGGGMSDLAIPSDGPDVFDGDNFYLKQPNGTLLRLIRYDDHLAALRACEQRVLEDYSTWHPTVVHQCCIDVQKEYARGFAAAREAVMQALGPMDCEDPDRYLTALAAIDVLREGKR